MNFLPVCDAPLCQAGAINVDFRSRARVNQLLRLNDLLKTGFIFIFPLENVFCI